MGMVALFWEVTPTRLERFREDGEANFIWDFEGESLGTEDGALSTVGLDKSWWAIHFVLTGTTEEFDGPLGWVLGGEPVGDDQGYGPARVFEPGEVGAIADVLRPLDSDAFAVRIDTAALRANDVYPGVWEDEDDHEYVMTYYTVLRDWVLGVAARGNGVVTIVG
ncbi:MAG: YfbM family protein [Planctomycetota bacterium]